MNQKCLIILAAFCLVVTLAVGNDKAPVCNEDELGCAFSLETNLPANDEAYSQCYLHDTSICPEGWTYNDNVSACTNRYAPLTSITACATKLESCDLLAYCGLPSASSSAS